MNRKQLGITLIALVITIVILLILAGITISAVTQNGLLAEQTNQHSKQKWQNIEKKQIYMYRGK